MNYQPVIGLEIHVELKTLRKMFCHCSAAYFGAAANSHTCPVCLGLPGALPMINQQAIEDCLKIGLALGCQVQPHSLFERKNYFYPDLAKGYQISQYRWPLCVKGELAGIRINRVHQEEDTGKLMHLGHDTAIDFNRSGVPLVEIVTEPDFKDSAQVREFAKKLQQLFRYLGVSNADMERGEMRLEANISVRPEGQTELPNYRVELKNINSFKFMADAIEFEIKRQSAALEQGEQLVQETRGWDQVKKQTFAQRSKEEAHDYRYFPDPDLPALAIPTEQVEQIQQKLPERPWTKAERLVQDYQLTPQQAQVLTEEQQLADYFEQAVKFGQQQQLSAKEIANQIVNKRVDIAKNTPEQAVAEILSQRGLVVSDQAQIAQYVSEVLAENQPLVAQYKAGKVAVLQALIGMVMRKAGGKAEAGLVRQLLEQQLA